MVVLVFLLQGIYGERQATLLCRRTALHMFYEHYSTRDCVLHILDNSNFCVIVFFFVHNAWIGAQFEHLAAPLGFRFSVHRPLNNTETVLFGVCFALMMCIQAEGKEGNTNVREAQQCTFWTLVIETSLFVDNAWLFLQLDHGVAHLSSRSFVQRDANNTETVIFTMFFAFVLYGQKVEQCNMTAYSARGESVNILDKLLYLL